MRHRITITALAAIVATAAALLSVAVSAQAPAPEAAFGYRVGEERRYVLGPPDALDPGEWAEWSLRLDRLEDGEEGWLARFEFSHERMERVPGSGDPTELITVTVNGELTTNLDGFPLGIRFQQEFSLRGEVLSGEGTRRIEYTYDRKKKRYEKVVEVGRRDWDFDFGIAKYGELDLDAERGLYVFMPTALACLGSSSSACNEVDPTFANPGLLSLAMPTLLEESDGEREFMFLMPTAIPTSPFFASSGAGPWLSRERDSIGNLARYFDQRKLKLGASTEVEVGPRTMHAWKLDVGGGIDDVWVEPEGRVLRIDLETTYDIRADRHIRLVFSWEGFMTPNRDPAEECC